MKQLDFTGGMPESETKTLVVFVDCHASHNVEIRVNEYYERMFRAFCKNQKLKCCIRSKRTEARIRQMEQQQRKGQQPQWRKADSLSARRKAIHERQIAAAFDLRVRTSMTEGGWA